MKGEVSGVGQEDFLARPVCFPFWLEAQTLTKPQPWVEPVSSERKERLASVCSRLRVRRSEDTCLKQQHLVFPCDLAWCRDHLSRTWEHICFVFLCLSCGPSCGPTWLTITWKKTEQSIALQQEAWVAPPPGSHNTELIIITIMIIMSMYRHPVTCFLHVISFLLTRLWGNFSYQMRKRRHRSFYALPVLSPRGWPEPNGHPQVAQFSLSSPMPGTKRGP